MMSVLKLVTLLQSAGISMSIQMIPFESLISRARNAAVAMFLSDPDATHILFIDSDIEFDAKDVLKLVQSGLDIVCGAYPQKWINTQLIAKHILRGNTNPLELSTKMSVHLVPTDTPSNIMEAEYVTTGFLLIKRDAIVKMIAKYPDKKYKNDIDGYAQGEDNFYDLFPTSIHPSTKRFESEDYGFSRLWRAIGGKLYVITDVTLHHHGWFSFPGNLFRQMTTPGQ
jgi:hypothetical protein